MIALHKLWSYCLFLTFSNVLYAPAIDINLDKEKKVKKLFMVYGAADNDLFPFAGRNIKEMQRIGSNDNIIIVFHFDMHRPGQAKVSKDFLIQKNKMLQIGPDACRDSGSAETLIDFCASTIKAFPEATEFDLIFWNHGLGILDPQIRRIINPSQLFRYNPETKYAELDRSIGFLDYIKETNTTKINTRGICFDDTTNNYLTNEKLKEALHTIVHEHLHGKKFNVIGFDACLMSMIEIASIVKDYAHIMVGSQEVELGTGWDYSAVLAPYLHGSSDNYSFAKNIVTAYHKTYSRITHDFTQSAIDLNKIASLEKNIDQVALTLMHGLQKQRDKTVKEAIKISRKNCTHFDEPTYLCLGDLYSMLLNNIHKCQLSTAAETLFFKNALTTALQEGKRLIAAAVIENTTGKNLSRAQGLSIYFPEYQIHSSYKKQKTKWLEFLEKYILA